MEVEKGNKFKLNYIYLFIFLLVLTPPIRLENIPSIRLEQVLLVVYFFYLIFLSFKRKKLQVKFNLPIGLFLGFAILIVISIFNGYLEGYGVILNDFFELFKIFIYLMTFLLIFSIENEGGKVKILNVLNLSILGSCLISFTQYFNPFDINELYIRKIAPTQYVTLVDNYPNPRVIGISGNPNIYGALLTIGIVVSIALYFHTKKKYNIFILVIEILTLFMTLSRTSFIFSLLSVFLLILLLSRKYVFNRKKNILKSLATVLISLIIFIVVIVLILNFLPDSLTWRIQSLLNITQERSFIMRINSWKDTLDHILKNPIIGIGPTKSSELNYSIDNEWLLFLKRYGIVGTIYFLIILFLPFLKKKIYKDFIGRVYISLSIGILLYMLPAAFYHSFQLMTVFMILYALTYEKRQYS